jgi:hypothetical protein
MWRAICAVILLPSLTVAQADMGATTPVVQSQPSPAANQGKPAYRAYTHYKEIRQGTAEDVAIQLVVPGFVTLPQSPVPGIVPLRLELQPAEGFAIGKIRYPKTYERKFSFQQEPVRVSGGWESPILIKLRADRNVSIGTHTLIGKMTFQVISDRQGVGVVQVVEVQIPITVVDHNAKLHKSEWPVHRLSTTATVLLIVLSPVLIAVVIPYYLICGAMGPQRCPD